MTGARRSPLLIIAATLVVGCSAGSSSEGSKTAQLHPDYLDTSANQVAHAIGCQHFRTRVLVAHALSAGTCQLEGHTVEIATFQSHREQQAWARLIIKNPTIFKNYHWASTNGAIVFDEHG